VNKLTADKCRHEIEIIKGSAGLGIEMSMRNELVLQAMEIALPVLEQQESTTDTCRKIENDGWIEWGGAGGCPVAAETNVIVRLTNPRDTLRAQAGEFEWSSEKANDPITAYRVIENDGREG
jgi:hypothetical protein